MHIPRSLQWSIYYAGRSACAARAKRAVQMGRDLRAWATAWRLASAAASSNCACKRALHSRRSWTSACSRRSPPPSRSRASASRALSRLAGSTVSRPCTTSVSSGGNGASERLGARYAASAKRVGSSPGNGAWPARRPHALSEWGHNGIWHGAGTGRHVLLARGGVTHVMQLAQGDTSCCWHRAEQAPRRSHGRCAYCHRGYYTHGDAARGAETRG